MCDDALILEGLLPCRKTRHGPINQSRNLPLLRLRRHNKQREGCGALPGIVGFLETIFSTIDPLTIQNNVTLRHFPRHVQLWFEFSLVVSHWWATLCASPRSQSISSIVKAKPELVDPSVSAFPTDTIQSPGEQSCLQGTLLLKRGRSHKNNEEKGKNGLFGVVWVIWQPQQSPCSPSALQQPWMCILGCAAQCRRHLQKMERHLGFTLTFPTTNTSAAAGLKGLGFIQAKLM